MKNWLVVLLALCFSITASASDVDAKKIEQALNDIFSATRGADGNRAAALDRYINPERCAQAFKGNGANRVSINGAVIENPGQAIQFHASRLDDHTVFAGGNTATVTAYLRGRLSVAGEEKGAGPWKLESFWFESDGNWYIEHLNLKAIDVPKLEYYTQFPPAYGQDTATKWPLIVFLHGTGERGGSLDSVKGMSHSIPKVAATEPEFRFVAVSPLCPSGVTWQEMSYALDALIDEVVETYSIDAERIYLTGLSMGGIGTWNQALLYPEKFAAIAPVCGTIEPAKAERLKDVPIWAFHGALDPIIAMDDEQKAIASLKALGSDVTYTVYQGLGHDVWTKAYTTPELYDWFLQHRRKSGPQ